MVLSKRERIIMIATLICVGILIVNQFIYGPVSKKLQALTEERQELDTELQKAEQLVGDKEALQNRWNDLLANGMRDSETAESVVHANLREWASTARLSVESSRFEHTSADKGMREMIASVSTEASLDSIARFLYEIETSAVPVKIRSISMGSQNDAGSTISVQIYLSILYIDPSSKESQPLFSEANYEDAT